MTNILLTGIPRVGKTALVDTTQHEASHFLEQSVNVLSLGDIVGETASDLWNTPHERRPNIDFGFQQVLRKAAVSEAARRLMLSDNDHNIVDSPMTMYLDGKTPNIIFSAGDMTKLHEACDGLDVVVTLIDDAQQVSRNLRGTDYPKGPDTLLNWMTYEADASQAITPGDTRKLVIPRQHSEQLVVKLLMDPQAPIGYYAFPIRSLKPRKDGKDTVGELKSKELAKRAIDDFRNKFEEYSGLFVPMVMADSREGSETEIRATEHRDLHQFIRHSTFTIAHFPDAKYVSNGVKDEMVYTRRTGGVVILIHPDEKFGKGAFGVVPDIYCRNQEEFFDLVNDSWQNKHNGKPEAYLRRFLMEKQHLPRYAMLREPVVAVDFVDEHGKHLIIQQPEGKPFAGHWTLVSGKKEEGQTDLKACQEESIQEVGLVVRDVDSPTPWLCPADYAARPDLKYVRFYQCSAGKNNFAGRVSPNHITSKEEVADAAWLSRDQILRSKRPMLDATRKYFQHLRR